MMSLDFLVSSSLTAVCQWNWVVAHVAVCVVDVSDARRGSATCREWIEDLDAAA